MCQESPLKEWCLYHLFHHLRFGCVLPETSGIGMVTSVCHLPVASGLIPLQGRSLRAHMPGPRKRWRGGEGLVPQTVFSQVAIKQLAYSSASSFLR